MVSLDFSSFDRKIFIRSEPETLYRAFATAEGLCSWFLEKAVFKDEKDIARSPTSLAQANDRYTWKWYNWDELETGRVTAADGRSVLEFEFAESKVRIQIGEKRNENLLVHLRQFDIPTDQESKLQIHYGCSNGWTFWLANLKAWLEHGILLNETEIDLRADPRAGFDFVNI